MGASNGPVVAQAWRYPVKSLGGERVAVCRADEHGLAGDRVWAVQGRDGKLGSGKNSRRFTRIVGLLGLSARYLAEPGADGIEPPAVTGPDGTEYPVATGAADEFLRQSTGLPGVQLVDRAPGESEFTIPDCSDPRAIVSYALHRLTIIIAAYQAFLDQVRARDDVSFALVVALLAAETHRRADAEAALAGGPGTAAPAHGN